MCIYNSFFAFCQLFLCVYAFAQLDQQFRLVQISVVSTLLPQSCLLLLVFKSQHLEQRLLSETASIGYNDELKIDLLCLRRKSPSIATFERASTYLKVISLVSDFARFLPSSTRPIALCQALHSQFCRRASASLSLWLYFTLSVWPSFSSCSVPQMHRSVAECLR